MLKKVIPMMTIRAGDTLAGRYRLDAILGRGGFGEVWRASDLRLPPRSVAVKFIRHPKPSADLLRRFETEARALAALNHPNIVSIIDQGDDAGQVYIVMELLVGQTLGEWIEEHRIRGVWPDQQIALEIFDQLASALEAAHTIKDPGAIVHRDIKPGNVFLVKGTRPADIHPKVVDFGLAQLGGRYDTPSNAVLGTPVYMAPEQALGHISAISPATDVFSLAVLLIELLTLELNPPSQPAWWLEVVRSPRSGRVGLGAPRPNLPDHIWEIVQSALSTKPEHRYPHAGEFRSALLGARKLDINLTLPTIALARQDKMRLLELTVQGCTTCRLSQNRRRPAFGRGAIPPKVMFVGEGPGVSDDATGLPFSGPPGRLLDNIVTAMGLGPDDVYICDVVKCRTPNNRVPEPDEIAACKSHWQEQIALASPQYLVTLGRVASQAILNTSESITSLRGKWASYNGIPTMPTYHPAFLLRSPADKSTVWSGLKQIVDRLEGGRAG